MPGVRFPLFLRMSITRHICRYKTRKKVAYLTFDDGPIPESTLWTLDLLREKGVRATFFCVGENVFKYPHLYERILKEGHAVGNHTFNHLNGIITSTDQYIENTKMASCYVESSLFRPPHGVMRLKQARNLARDYSLIMWDVLSGDHHRDITPRQCLDRVVKYTRPGSIIVFHNNLKSEENMRYALPRVIDILHSEGYSFDLCF